MVYLIYGLWIDPLAHWKNFFSDITTHLYCKFKQE